SGWRHTRSKRDWSADVCSSDLDVAHEYVHMASDPVQIRHLVDRAIRIAKNYRTVTCIIVPNDVQELEAVETPPRAHGTVHSGIEIGRAACSERARMTGAARGSS